MFGSHVAVLDFGSSKLTVLVGTKSGLSYRVEAKGMSDYAGFMDGDFLQPEQLRDAVSGAVAAAGDMLHKKIKSITVGVPAEFCYNDVETLEMRFSKPTRIKMAHLNRLFVLNKDKLSTNTHTVINKVPIHYVVDNNQTVAEPVGTISTVLQAWTSLIFVDNRFMSQVTEALNDIGIWDIEFICNSLAEGLCLIEPSDRENGAVFVDCGYISTSVTSLLKEGVLDLKSFSLGGGHITSDLSELLKIPFDTAEQLKRKLVISLDAQPQDYYEAELNEKITKFSAKTVNDISLARIDMIAETILKCFADFTYPISASAKVYLTGGGLSYLKGMKDYLTKYLQRDIIVAAPSLLQYNKPDLSSELSLLEVAISMENA